MLFPATGGADRRHAGLAGRMHALRATSAALSAEERAAVLQLYALDSRLDRARAALAEADARLAANERARAAAARELAAARHTAAVAQTRLGAAVRALYEQQSPDALAVVLGAASLDDIVSGLDDLRRSARSNAALAADARGAQTGLVRVLASLRRRSAQLRRLRQAAAATAAEVAAAQSERSAYLERLRTRQHLERARIAALDARARRAEAVATVATVQAEAVKSLASFTSSDGRPQAAPAAPSPAAPAALQPAAGSSVRLTVIATAYSLPGSTASGLPVGPGVVAVDPTVIPLGTRMYVPGYGPAIAADTGMAIKGLRIDLWFATLAQAQAWGARTVTITLR